MAEPPKRSTASDDDGANNYCCNSGALLLKWVFRGNVIVPTGNPFQQPPPPPVDDDDNRTARAAADSSSRSNDDASISSGITWLGPGLQLLHDHVLAVDVTGRIRHLEPAASFFLLSTNSNNSKSNNTTDDDQQQPPPREESSAFQIQQLDPRLEFLCPGFVDLHLHAPQFAVAGTGTDLPLLGAGGWLEACAFPAERRLRDDAELARTVADAAVRTTLRHGTTTAVYFGALDAAPCRALVDSCLRAGQRGLVGKVCMDRNAPDDYRQSAARNVREAEAVMEYIYSRAGKERPRRRQGGDDDGEDEKDTNNNALLPLVLPLVIPRFIPTCSPQLLAALGRLAARHDGCHITTHASESLDEVAFSRRLDAADDLRDGVGRTDCAILEAHGLLTDRSVLAHGVHLTPADERLLQRRGAAVAHCPLSNFFFAGGCLPCRRYLQQQPPGGRIKVGLGTDVAGGYSPSMLHAQRLAVVASRARQQQEQQQQQQQKEAGGGGGGDANNNNNDNDNDPVLDYRHAFYLATLGGAEALGLQESIGTLAVGMEFDALVLSAKTPSSSSSSPSPSPVPVFDSDTVSDVFQKLCVLGDDRNVARVFVQGREVTERRS